MKILKLTAENFKRLKAVEIIPDPTTNLIQVRGRNGQGKSSVLDAIWAAVGGAQAQPSRPVRNGADKATITLDLGDIVITRRFNADKNTTDLRLEAADGARYTSPQTMLDRLIGAVAFDPLEFTRQKPRDQFETLRPLVKLPIDVVALDTANQSDYAIRTNTNRDIQALRVRLDALPPPADTELPLPIEPIDVQALTQRLAQASDHNTDIVSRRAARASATERVTVERRAAEIATTTGLAQRLAEIDEHFAGALNVIDHEISELETRLTDLCKRRLTSIEDHKIRAEIADNEAWVRANTHTLNADTTQAKLDAASPLPDPIDTTALANEIEIAHTINVRLERLARRTDIQKQLAEAEAESGTLTEQMKLRTAQKTKALAAATYPIPGLTLGEGEVLYNNVPLDQASQAEKIRVGVAVAIAANPKLRVIAVRDGSLLDTESMQLLSSLVTEADYQCWIEVTDDDAKIGVIIEDGTIAQPVFSVVGEPAATTEEALPL